MADESSKPDEPAANAGADIPEIEAEIVEEDAASAHESAFTDSETIANPADVEAEAKPSPKRMPFTPGVILFFAFAAFALLVFAVWRLQGPDKTPVAEAQQHEEEAPPIDNAPKETDVPEINKNEDPAHASDFAVNVTDEAADDIDAANTESAGAAPIGAGRSKIENSQIAESKDTMSDLGAIPDSATRSEMFLPPLGSDKAKIDGNHGLQQTAKDAYSAADPTTGSTLPENNGEAALPLTDAAPAFEVEDSEANRAAQNQSGADQQPLATVGHDGQAGASESKFAAAAGQTPPAPGGVEENAKLLNDIAGLKQSFEAEKAQLTMALEDERQRNANQREEIEVLRRDFQAALNARDDQANAELRELRERINKIRNDEITPIARQIAGAAALKSLERAFGEGRPFVAELDTFEQAAPGAPAVVILRKFAGAGIVPMRNLKDRFGAAASKALAAARKEQANGVAAALIAQAQNIITIRPAKPRSGAAPGAVISRAEYAVENNDLAGALAELENLPSAARDAMTPWIRDAQARNEVVSAMDDLNNLVFGALSQ